jgi:hypothetical protein
MESPIDLILGIISYLIKSSIETLANVLKFLGDLLQSLGFVSGSGLLVFLISVLILSVVLILVWKFVIGSLKIILLLFLAGLVILGILFVLA